MNNSTTATRILSACIAILLLGVASAQATVPPAPIGLRGSVYDVPNAPGTIVLQWASGDSLASNGGFYIYQGLRVQGVLSFSRIATLPDSNGILRTWSMPANALGDYFFYVTGYNNDGEGAPSDTINLTVVAATPWVSFGNNYYGDSLHVGDTLRWQLQASTNSSSAINYGLLSGPNGATIDQASGLLTWVADSVGSYNFQVKAWLVDDTTVSKTTTVRVSVTDRFSDDRLTFQSGNFTFTAKIGTPFIATVAAAAKKGDLLWYALDDNAPAGLTINTNSGVITWTPTTVGTVTFNVRAGIAGETNWRITTACRIVVQDSAVYRVIAGLLQDSTGSIQLYGTINFYSVQNNPNGIATYSLYRTVAVRGGAFYENLAAGSYILEGLPDDTSYAAAYYKQGALGVSDWNSATRIALGNNTFGDSILFRLPYAPGHHGSNHLKGVVYNGSGRAKEGSGSSLLGSTPLEGAVVVAFDANGLISSWAITGPYGSYDLSRLGSGTYMISVSKVGFKSTTRSATFAADNGMQLDFDQLTIDPVGSASSVPVTTAASSAITASPNPATAGTTLSFTAKGGSGTIRMVSSDGRTVMTRAITTLAGPNRIEVTTEGIADGYYLVQLTVGDESMILPIVVAR